jgi:hypothetical protein
MEIARQAAKRAINARKTSQESDERQVQDKFISSIMIIA